MAVALTQGVSIELYPGGNLDPRLPAGRWFAQLNPTGTATGGTVTATAEFFPIAAVPNTFCFTLDQLTANRVDGAADAVTVQTLGFSPAIGGTEFLRSWGIALVAGVGLSTQNSAQLAGMMPLLLGYRIDATQAAIAVVFGGNTDTIEYYVTMSGEFWLQQAGLYIGAQQPAGSPAFEASRPAEAQGAMIDIRAGRPPPQAAAAPTLVTAGQRLDRDQLATPVPLTAPAVPIRPKPVLASPAAAQDPHAELRRAYVQTLAAMGMQTATIPGGTIAEITQNFMSLKTTLDNRALNGVPAVFTLPMATPKVGSSRSGASASTTNPKAGGTLKPAPTVNNAAGLSFADNRFAIKRLNIAALKGPIRSGVINPTGGNSVAWSPNRRDILENEG